MNRLLRSASWVAIWATVTGSLLAQGISISGERRPSGKGWAHHLINNYSSPALAFKASYSCSGGGMDKYYDPLIDYGSYGPLKSGEAYDVPLSEKLKDCKGDVVAAIYADGSTQGDSTSVEAILSRRRAAYTELMWIEDEIYALQKPDPDFAQVLDAINTRIAAVNKMNMSSGDWSGGNAVLHYVSYLISAKSIPPDTGPSATPLPTVKQLILKKKYTAPQAYAVALTERLRQWSDKLRIGVQN